MTTDYLTSKTKTLNPLPYLKLTNTQKEDNDGNGIDCLGIKKKHHDGNNIYYWIIKWKYLTVEQTRGKIGTQTHIYMTTQFPDLVQTFQ